MKTNNKDATDQIKALNNTVENNANQIKALTVQIQALTDNVNRLTGTVTKMKEKSATEGILNFIKRKFGFGS